MNIPRLIIAAPSSGSGKSLVASGLMAAFSRRISVQGFKIGPDYLDPMYHTVATGRPSRNLDTWMLSRETVCQGFKCACRDADLAIIEGAMGLFDGYNSEPLNGSSAEVAYILSAPIILVIDCARMSGSAAALAHGFNTFVPEVQLSGVICNRVGSESHAAWLRGAFEKIGLPVLGCIPRLPDLQIPERHLGLFTVAERPEAVRDFLSSAADAMLQYLDLPAIRALAETAEASFFGSAPLEPITPAVIRLAVARDEAFCFYYEDNLDQLRQAGAEIIPFSPLRDEHLPPGVSGLYLGGGYPELYAPQLSANRFLVDEIRNAHHRMMPIYAECGGLIYLTEGIHLLEGDFPLVGLVPGWCRMGNRLTMGYREVETVKPCLFGDAGLKLRGHEFHYSEWQNTVSDQAVYLVSSRNNGNTTCLDGHACGCLLASYIHLHFGQNSSLAHRFVQTCHQWQLGESKR